MSTRRAPPHGPTRGAAGPVLGIPDLGGLSLHPRKNTETCNPGIATTQLRATGRDKRVGAKTCDLDAFWGTTKSRIGAPVRPGAIVSPNPSAIQGTQKMPESVPTGVSTKRGPDGGGGQPEKRPITAETMGCAASIMHSETSTDYYKLTAYEPPEITELPKYPTVNENKNPNDYIPMEKQHNIAPIVRAYYATDATMQEGKECLLEAAEAQQQLAEYAESFNQDPAHLESLRAAAEEAKSRASGAGRKSRPLTPKSCTCTFDPAGNTIELVTSYVNTTGLPMMVNASLEMHEGLKPVRSYSRMKTYTSEELYVRNKEAEQLCQEAKVSKTSGGARQTVSKQRFGQDDVNVPAFASAANRPPGSPREPAEFDIVFVVAFTDVEENAVRLPEVEGMPSRIVSDFALMVPPTIAGESAVPFTLSLKTNPLTKRMLASRASAKLDTDRRNMPTYWLDGEESVVATFERPYAQSPCIRWRTVKNALDVLDFPIDELLGDMRLNDEGSGDQITAKVRSWIPFGDTQMVAEIEMESSNLLKVKLEEPPKTHHFVFVVDVSYSMTMRVGPKNNFELACDEMEKVVKKIKSFPRKFRNKVVGANDKFLFTLLKFHNAASEVVSRVELGTNDTDAKLATAIQTLKNSDHGGTAFTPAVNLMEGKVDSNDHVACMVLTDGQIFDRKTFVNAYDDLKKKAMSWRSTALGCGAWADFDTAKLIGTDGMRLLDKFDDMVSSTAIRLLAGVLADQACTMKVGVGGTMLTRWGEGGNVSMEGDGQTTSFTMGLGAKRRFTVIGDRVRGNDDGYTLPDMFIDGADGRIRINVEKRGATKSTDMILRVLDPLFCPAGVKMIKNSSSSCDKRSIHDTVIEGIGLHNKCFNSLVTVYTHYKFDAGDDNSVKGDTKASVPPLAQADFPEPGPDFLPPVTVYHGYSEDDEEPVFQSLGADDDEAPVFQSLGADDDGSPAFRSLSADDEAPAPVELQEEEVGNSDKPITFEALVHIISYNALLPYITTHLPTALFGIEHLLKTFEGYKAQLGFDPNKPISTKGDAEDLADLDDDESMDEDALVKKLEVALTVFYCYAMRFHLHVHKNLAGLLVNHRELVDAVLELLGPLIQQLKQLQ